jgi:hypothetical protein
MAEKLWEMSLDGTDDEFGSTDEAPGRWWGLQTKTGVPGAQHAIVTQDSQGFVQYETYRTAKAARAWFNKIVREVSREMGEDY